MSYPNPIFLTSAQIGTQIQWCNTFSKGILKTQLSRTSKKEKRQAKCKKQKRQEARSACFSSFHDLCYAPGPKTTRPNVYFDSRGDKHGRGKRSARLKTARRSSPRTVPRLKIPWSIRAMASCRDIASANPKVDVAEMTAPSGAKKPRPDYSASQASCTAQARRGRIAASEAEIVQPYWTVQTLKVSKKIQAQSDCLRNADIAQ